MSIDPETARQIAELSLDERPLLVLDVDDVLLEFIGVFPKYLDGRGFDLKLDTWQLGGNIFERDTKAAAAQDKVRELLYDFFDTQHEWQEMIEGAADAMAAFGDSVEIVLLTAMPHRFRERRRIHLDALGLTYPLLTTEMAKGPAILSLRGKTGRPVAFVDDQPRNLASAHQSVPDAHLFNLMSDNSLRALLPPPADYINVVDDWRDAQPKIAAALGV